MSGRALVTGGASGIGAATVARLREDGYRVAAIDRDAAAVERSAAADSCWAPTVPQQH